MHLRPASTAPAEDLLATAARLGSQHSTATGAAGTRTRRVRAPVTAPTPPPGDDTLKGGDGNDVLSSGQGFGGDLNQAGRGNDIMLVGAGIQPAEVMLGFDWFTHDQDPSPTPADSDMALTGGIRDATGNPLTTYTWTFTTGS